MKTITCLFLIHALLFIQAAKAQSPVNSVTGGYSYVNLTPTQVAEAVPLMLQLEPKAFSITVTLGSTTGYTKLGAMLGSSAGSNDVFYKEFTLGTDGNFEDGTSYHTTGNTVQIGLGNHSGGPNYYAEVFAIKNDTVRSAGIRAEIQ